DPSNFARILDLYGHSHEAICADISGATYSDDDIRQTIRTCLAENKYQLDPHGACGYQALKDGLKPGETGIFLETAHPAKFKSTVDDITGGDLKIPSKLRKFMEGTKKSVPLSKNFDDFKAFLDSNAIR
ncbi:MAG: threonine synthase, partial [Paludibacteraceae bacterium]|nr:threonine synthase [Paludibacteraceae bacterium]